MPPRSPDEWKVIGRCWACGGPLRRFNIAKVIVDGVVRTVHKGACQHDASGHSDVDVRKP